MLSYDLVLELVNCRVERSPSVPLPDDADSRQNGSGTLDDPCSGRHTRHPISSAPEAPHTQ